MLKKFLSWLIDTYLYDLIVLREDYDSMYIRATGAECWTTRILRELNEAYEQLYSRKYKSYETEGEAIVGEVDMVDRIDIREFRVSYSFHIPHSQYYTYDRATIINNEIRDVVINKLVKAFEAHIRHNLWHKL